MVCLIVLLFRFDSHHRLASDFQKRQRDEPLDQYSFPRPCVGCNNFQCEIHVLAKVEVRTEFHVTLGTASSCSQTRYFFCTAPSRTAWARTEGTSCLNAFVPHLELCTVKSTLTPTTSLLLSSLLLFQCFQDEQRVRETRLVCFVIQSSCVNRAHRSLKTSRVQSQRRRFHDEGSYWRLYDKGS